MKVMAKLLAVSVLAAATLTSNAIAGQKAPTIVEIATGINETTGEFSTLIAALKHTGLVDALNGKKQFTVFAPTDAAFAKLNLDATSITNLPPDAVADILLYHVAPGKRPSQAVAGSKQIKMLNGDFALIGPGPTVDGAKVILPDVKASNGIIHVVEDVLLPPTDE